MAGFLLAVLCFVLIIDLLLLWFSGALSASRMARAPGAFLTVSLLLAGWIGVVCWRKARELRGGGAAVASSLGGSEVAAASTDSLDRRLLNVVQEMALAARLPMPRVFVLRQDAGINAFAAGHHQDDAAVAVTQGALQRLSREELQAVIGHEFSHVLNGDMALNLRMIIGLHGLYAITALARGVVARRKRRRWTRNSRLIVLAVVIAAVGSVGLFIGRIIQAAVSRGRECLADASAVQFTRNPLALKNALLKIAGSADGARIASPAAAGAAHLLFASGDRSWLQNLGRVFATHPSLAERIQALDPEFDLRQLKSLAARAGQAADELAAGFCTGRTAVDDPTVGIARTPVATGAAGTVTPAQPLCCTLQPLHATASPVLLAGAPDAVLTLDSLHSHWPVAGQQKFERLLEQYRAHPFEVLALAIATSLPQALQQRRPIMQQLARVSGGKVLPSIAWASNALQRIPQHGHLALLLALAPQLAMLSGRPREQLLTIAKFLCRQSGAPQIPCFALLHILLHGLPAPNPSVEARLLKLTDCVAAIAVTANTLAIAGHSDDAQARRAFKLGMQTLLPPVLRPRFVPARELWAEELDAALLKLRDLQPVARKALAAALAAVVAADGVVTVPEAELLRLCCVVTATPLPALPHRAEPQRVTRSA